MGCQKLNIQPRKSSVLKVVHRQCLEGEKECGNYYPFGMKWETPVIDQNGNSLEESGVETSYTYNGKELVDDLDINLHDYGARYYDPAIARFTTIDPVAEAASGWTPYRYAFNNPIIFIDPDGMYEWRVNSQTGEYERFGDKGGDSEQHVYWDDAIEAAFSLKGETIYVGAVANDRFNEGEFSYGVSTQDLWSDVPDEYQGAYDKFDLAERYEAQQSGNLKYESIKQQEAAGLSRQQMIWNSSDYGAYLDGKYGSQAGFIMAYDSGLLNSMMPGGFNQSAGATHNALRGASSKSQGFNPNFGSSNKGGRVPGSGPVPSPAAAPQQKMSWNQFRSANKGKFKGKNHMQKAAKAYKKYKASFK